MVGDVFSVSYMARFRRECGHKGLFMAFLIFMGPAVLASLYSMYSKCKRLHVTLKQRNEESMDSERQLLPKIRAQGAKMDLCTLLEAFQLELSRRQLVEQQWQLAEQQNINQIDRERAAFHLLLALTEDLPFCVLNSILIAIPMREELSPECSAWSHGTEQTVILAVLLFSVASLTYKATHLMLFPSIWMEYKRLTKEEGELAKRTSEQTKRASEHTKRGNLSLSELELNGAWSTRRVASQPLVGASLPVELAVHAPSPPDDRSALPISPLPVRRGPLRD